MSAALAVYPPESIASEAWITKEQILQRANISSRWIELLCAKGVIISRDMKSRGRNGRPLREYLVDSLPPELQAKLEPQELHPPVATAPSPLAIQPLFAGIVEQASVPAIVAPEHRAEVQRCYKLIEPLLDFKRDPAKYRALRLADGRAVTSIDTLAEYLAASEVAAGRKASRRSLLRWKSAWEKNGDAALAPKRRVDKGRSKWAAEHRAMADLAAWMHMGDNAQPGQSVRVAWEQVCAYAAEIGAKAPSYETVRSFLENPNEVSLSMKTLQAKGRKGYDAVFAGYLKRGYTEPANQIWVSDHMICDVLVQDDCFEKDLKHCRIQMTTILDYRSRLVVGVSWCRNGSSHSIKRALLGAILRYGPPEVFYIDNGKDFRKVGGRRRDPQTAQLAGEEFDTLRGTFLNAMDIQAIYCKAYHPQSKHIEKYHAFYHQRVDRAFLTYTAGATHLRRDETVTALVKHQKLVSIGDTRESDLPLASEYIAMAEAWIFETYNQRPHDGEGMNGRSPAQCFAQELNPNQKPTPPFEHLAALMAEMTRRKVRNGAVEIDGTRFVAAYTDARATAILHELSGRDGKANIAYDPLDMQRAALLSEDYKPLCHLVAQGLTRFSNDEETRAEIAAMEQQRNGMHKAARQSIAALGERVKARGHKPLVAQLREQAGLPTVSSIVQKPRKTASGETAAAPLYNADAADLFFRRRTLENS